MMMKIVAMEIEMVMMKTEIKMEMVMATIVDKDDDGVVD